MCNPQRRAVVALGREERCKAYLSEAPWRPVTEQCVKVRCIRYMCFIQDLLCETRTVELALPQRRTTIYNSFTLPACTCAYERSWTAPRWDLIHTSMLAYNRWV